MLYDFIDIDDTVISLSNEEYTEFYRSVLLKQVAQLTEVIRKDKDLNIDNQVYFTLDRYKQHIENIEKGIKKQFKLNFKLVPSEDTIVSVDNNDNDVVIKEINKFITGKKIDIKTTLEKVKGNGIKLHGKKFSGKGKVYLGLNFNKLLFEENKTDEEITDIVLNVIEGLYKNVNDSKELLDIANKIYSASKEGKDLTHVYTNILGGTASDIEDSSDIVKIQKISNLIIDRATDYNEDKEKEKLHILVRINYLIILVVVLMTLYAAFSISYLGIALVALLVYNIFLYVYKLVSKIFTGERDPLKESVSYFKANNLNNTYTELVGVLEKNKKQDEIKSSIELGVKPEQFVKGK